MIRIERPPTSCLTALLVVLAAVGLWRADALAQGFSIASDAPLDTLVTEAPRPAASADMGISRRLLPDVSTTTIPRQAPPAAPPRLDDPDSGWRLFQGARNTAGQLDQTQLDDNLRVAREVRPGDSRIPIWQMMRALQNRDPGAFVWHVPGALRAVLGDPLAAPRLAVQGHQAALLMVAIFWTVLVVAGLVSVWRHLAHDTSAVIMRDPDHRLRLWTPWLIILGVIVVRPGWLGALALLSIAVLLQTRGGVRNLILATWLAALALVFPNWPLLREAVPVLDPDSETNLLVQAGEQDASLPLITALRERLTTADDDAERQDRLRIALAHQEARRGRYTASTKLFDQVLASRPSELSALVGRANNNYFLSRFDAALADYHAARELAPERGEIPFNQAQVYFKKLFVPEAGQCLEDARALGFDPPTWQEGTRAGTSFSPAVYLGVSRADLRASARSEMHRYVPLAWLSSWNYFLSAPPLPLFVLMSGLLVVALVLTYWGGLQDNIRTCDTCGAEICRGCCTAHDEGWLCRECIETADRSRSEMVLATLLKNRSRAVGLATTSRLVWQARLLPGSAYLSLGEPGKAWGRLSMLALAVFMITCGWAFDPAATWSTPGLILATETVHPLWLPLPAAAWPGLLQWPVMPGWALLAAVYLVGLIDAARLRVKLPERFVQVHSPGPVTGSGRA